MNPQKLAENLNTNMVEYIRSAMPIEDASSLSDDMKTRFRDRLDGFFDRHKLVQDPYLELMKPYQQGATLQKLQHDGIILPQTADIFAQYFGGPKDQIHLHSHQENAVRAVHDGQNLVVCSGTGSGKTECFLIPIIDSLLRNIGNPGVKVLLLYPMNALVNDQIRRLRRLLKNEAERARQEGRRPITFGLYTGELASVEDEKNARLNWDDEQSNPAHQALQILGRQEGTAADFDDSMHLPNEVTRRTQWRDDPADIMVTNFVMLERLLLNPETSNLFDPQCPWRFIVLDEAHSYNGSLGTDLAWLMRRLYARIGSPANLRFIATSATLSAENDRIAIIDDIRVNFASKLFPAPADTFSVEIGDPADIQLADNRRDTAIDLDTVRNAHFGNGDNAPLLLNATREWFDDRSLLKSDLFESFETLIGREGEPNLGHTLGNALFLLRLAKRFKDLQGEEGVPPFDLPDRLFADTAFLNTLKEFLERWNQLDTQQDQNRNFWRDKLHDYMDPAKSSLPNDNNPIGNRLHLIDEWNHDPGQISLTGVEWLVKLSTDLLEQLNYENANRWQDIDIARIPVTLAPGYAAVFTVIRNWYHDFCNEHEQRRNTLVAAWRDLLNAPQVLNDIPHILGWGLSGGNLLPNAYDLLNTPTAEEVKFSVVANRLGISTEELNDLLSLCSIARVGGSRFPILDVRIHQFLRGLSGVGIYNIRQDGQGQWDFDLTDSYEETIEENGQVYRVYSLGVCRDCGQPYILAYTNENNGNELVRYADEQHPRLHAFWFAENANGAAGEQPQPGVQGANQNNGIAGLNLTNGTWAQHPDGNYIAVKHCAAVDNNNPENIRQCPFCGGAPTGNAANARFGIITPYAAAGTPGAQLQMCVIDTLAKNLDPSPNPLLRALPGAGRKLLVFSDSRQGAATLALKYQEFWAEETLGAILKNIPNQFNNNLEQYIHRLAEIDPGAIALRQMGLNVPYNINDAYSFYCQMLLDLQDLKMDSLLNAEDNTEPTAMARFRFLQPLLRRGRRHNIVVNKVVDIRSQLYDQIVTDQKQEAAIRENLGFSQENFKPICDEIYRYLWCRTAITCTDQVLWQEARDVLNRKKKTWNQEKFQNDRNIQRILKDNEFADNNQINAACVWLWQNVFSPRQNNDHGLLLQPGNEYYLNIFGANGALNFRIEPGENYQAAEEPIPIRIEEHTAQLSKLAGSAFQRAFSNGQINILSCSTTFEMGVDLGDLNCLYMANLPPGVANYRQRAGRAGRRAGSTAYVLTMLNAEDSDEAYFDHAEKLIFGAPERPMIYLDRPVYRARHLRAEALHRFLKWVDTNPQNATRVLAQRNIERNWDNVAHFFAGAVVYRNWRDNNQLQITDTFQPMKDLLANWAANEQNTGHWWENIRGCRENGDFAIPGLGAVTNPVQDFVWQMVGGGNPPCDRDHVRDLGCRRPENEDGYESPVCERFLTELNSLLPENMHLPNANPQTLPWNIPTAAYLILQGRTLNYLCHQQVLPKYGFPVDVMPLMPAENDPYKKMTEDLERPRHIGIFEYAPKMSVVANKRIYVSAKPMFYQAQAGNDEYFSVFDRFVRHWSICSECHALFQQARRNAPQCCDHPDLHDIYVCIPDAFRAQNSRGAGIGGGDTIINNPGVRYNTIFNALTDPQPIDGLNLRAAETQDGEVVYLNQGPRGKGFTAALRPEEAQNQSYAICHIARTDIVHWRPAEGQQWGGEFSGSRLRNAMESAAAALVKAAAECLNIRGNEISILSVPNAADDRFGFFFYDETPGGNGILRRLKEDHALISQVINHARGICHDCDCNPNDDHPEWKPVDAYEYLNNHNQNTRRAASCYKCLRTYQNKRIHKLLDRYDALKILEAMSQEGPAAEAQPAPVAEAPNNGFPGI